MGEQKRRYRANIGKAADDQRAQYRRAAEKQAAQEDADSDSSQMTYDDYLESLKDVEKLIEIDDDSRWTKFKDFVGEYTAWLGAKHKKYTPLAKKKLAHTARTVYEKQPIDRQNLTKVGNAAQNRLKPLNRKFGAKNVKFGGVTGIVVLVLLGGFLLFRGGESKQGEVAAATDETGNSQSSQPADPTFEVAVTDTVSDEQGVFFDPEVGVASFRDLIRGNTVTVSQQPLTDQQKGDRENQLELIAVQLAAPNSFNSKFGTVYTTQPTGAEGTDPSQVAMFMTDELLIFIRTAGVTIAPEGWQEYIETIRT